MTALPARRFKKLYERVLLSRIFALGVGLLFSVVLPASLYWGPDVFQHPNTGQRTALMATALAFVLSHFSAKNLLSTYPGGRTQGLITTQVVVFYGVVILGTLLLRIEVSRVLLLSSGAAALIWFHIEYVLTRAYFRPKLAVIPGGFADEILQLPDCDARPLPHLYLGTIRYDGIVADFQQLDADQEKFLASCALANIPVYNAKTVYESLTGRVRIDHMSENNIGSLLPSTAYETVKTISDWLLVMLSTPIVVPIGLITAILIRLESPGPAIYAQIRIGRGNRPFVLYKFRSMRTEPMAREAFAGDADPRVTRVGRIIRKLRIDELPQLVNVLKGEMSLIGPRPEQPGFVAAFTEQVPFYSCRHVIRPGITGWAQVRQGYTADTDQTQIKIEYDFYYIKNYSLTLDFLIVFLTIKTMFTGFGAR